jgi:SPX domain protein involved in polyphosphate accumulation
VCARCPNEPEKVSLPTAIVTITRSAFLIPGRASARCSVDLDLGILDGSQRQTPSRPQPQLEARTSDTSLYDLSRTVSTSSHFGRCRTQ